MVSKEKVTVSLRSMQFFMRSDEFNQLVWEIAAKHNLTVIFWRIGTNLRLEKAMQSGTLLMSDEKPADRLFFTDIAPLWIESEGVKPNPVKWGWVDTDVPVEANNMLFIAQMASKSDWWDSEHKQVVEIPKGHELFKKIRPMFLKHLKRPVWARGVEGGARVYREIGYSVGAAEWENNGGELRQGVAGSSPGRVWFMTKQPSE